MKRRTLLQSIPALALAPTAWAAKPSRTEIFELRVYYAHEGKFDDLLKRFREHASHLFEKHGMRNVACWTPTDPSLKGKALFYLIAHASREAANTNWQAFEEDAEWQRVRVASEAHGPLVEKVDSTFLTLTDFSPAV